MFGSVSQSLDWNIDWSSEMGYRIVLEKRLKSFFCSNTHLCHVPIYLITHSEPVLPAFMHPPRSLRGQRPHAYFFYNKSDISYLKTGRAFDIPIHSSQTLLVSNSVGTMNSCSLLAFLLLVSLVSSRPCCLCFSVSISKSQLW